MEEIIQNIEEVTGVSQEQIRSTDTKAKIVAARLLFARLAMEAGYKDRQIADFLGRARSTIVSMRTSYKGSYWYDDMKVRYKNTDFASKTQSKAQNKPNATLSSKNGIRVWFGKITAKMGLK